MYSFVISLRGSWSCSIDSLHACAMVFGKVVGTSTIDLHVIPS